jgi:hypothetical protein
MHWHKVEEAGETYAKERQVMAADAVHGCLPQMWDLHASPVAYLVAECQYLMSLTHPWLIWQVF